MDDNRMKDNIENNSKRNSLAESIIVKWKWNDSRQKRIFEGLRFGGTAETEYDLGLKYPEESVEHESLLLYANQLVHLTEVEKKTKIFDLLASEEWHWETDESNNFNKRINELF